MAIQYDRLKFPQLPTDLSALGNLKVAIQENSAAGTDQDVNIAADAVGLAKETTLSSMNTKMTQPTALKGKDITIDNSGGGSALTQQLFASSTASKYALIRNTHSTTDVKIGDNVDRGTVKAGKEIETQVSDLSNVYVEVAAGLTATLTVYWEP